MDKNGRGKTAPAALCVIGVFPVPTGSGQVAAREVPDIVSAHKAQGKIMLIDACPPGAGKERFALIFHHHPLFFSNRNPHVGGL